ncbi:MAG TPA: hypothetical protein VGW75_06040, partial [Solirubrobacteraceae bacterium]|nr:hypothetical protein [Solirubrobacteraceae bacterium]
MPHVRACSRERSSSSRGVLAERRERQRGVGRPAVERLDDLHRLEVARAGEEVGGRLARAALGEPQAAAREQHRREPVRRRQRPGHPGGHELGLRGLQLVVLDERLDVRRQPDRHGEQEARLAAGLDERAALGDGAGDLAAQQLELGAQVRRPGHRRGVAVRARLRGELLDGALGRVRPLGPQQDEHRLRALGERGALHQPPPVAHRPERQVGGLAGARAGREVRPPRAHRQQEVLGAGPGHVARVGLQQRARLLRRRVRPGDVLHAQAHGRGGVAGRAGGARRPVEHGGDLVEPALRRERRAEQRRRVDERRRVGGQLGDGVEPVERRAVRRAERRDRQPPDDLDAQVGGGRLGERAAQVAHGDLRGGAVERALGGRDERLDHRALAAGVGGEQVHGDPLGLGAGRAEHRDRPLVRQRAAAGRHVLVDGVANERVREAQRAPGVEDGGRRERVGRAG